MEPIPVPLDIYQPKRGFTLTIPKGTAPLFRCTLSNNGTAITHTGWTGQLFFSESAGSDTGTAIDSTSTASGYIDFQLTGSQTLVEGRYFCQFLFTDSGGRTVEWNRGAIDFLASPGTDSPTAAELTTPLNWASFTYTNTGSAGPYRAGTNITFSGNVDGSVDINANTSGVSDGDKGDITVSSSGTVWTIDNSAVTLAKIQDIGTGKVLGRHTSGNGVVQELTVDGGLELQGAQIQRSALTGDVTASAGSNTTTIASGAVDPAMLADADFGAFTVASGVASLDGGVAADNLWSGLPAENSAVVRILVNDGTTIGQLPVSTATAVLKTDGSGNADWGAVPAGALTNVNHRVNWTSMEAFLVTSANVGYSQYNHASRAISVFCAKSATGSLQAATIRFPAKRIPYGFAAFKETGAITLKYLGDSTSSSDIKITGITLYGTDLTTGSETTLYTDSTARTPGTADIVVAVSIDRSSFSSTTVPDYIIAEVGVQVANSKQLGVLSLEVNAE